VVERLHAHAPPRRAVKRRRGRSAGGPQVEPRNDRIAAEDGGSRLRAARALQGQIGNAAVQRLVQAVPGGSTSAHFTAPSLARLGLLDDDNEADDATTAANNTVADGQGTVEEAQQDAPAAQPIENTTQAGSGPSETAGAGQDDSTQLNTATGVGSTTFNVVPAEESRGEDTLNDVASVLSARGEAGSTQPSFGQINTDLDANSVVKSATLTVTETVTTPTWTKRDAQCDPIKTEWDRFHVAITAHEQKHVALDRKWFANIHASLVGLKDSDVDAKVAAIQAKAQTDNDAMDATTAHGVNEGTGINAGIRCSSKVP
jgi:Bacterial protein of unknown function (DUF922)